jgi:hypothetical protein
MAPSQRLRDGSENLRVEKPRFEFTLDAGYTANTQGSDENPFRGFDRRAKLPSLNLAEVKAEFPFRFGKNSSFTAVADGGAGRKAAVVQSLGLQNEDVPFDLFQLYGELKIRKFHLRGGQSVTTAGSEYINSFQNDHYSIPWYFDYFINYKDLGLRIGYGGGKSDVTAGVIRGWDKTFYDNNKTPSGLFNFVLTPHDAMFLGLTYIVGPEKDGNVEDVRHMGDLALSVKPADSFKMMVNVNVGGERGGDRVDGWFGTTGYLFLRPKSGPAALAARIEYARDTGSRFGFPVELLGVTGGLNFYIGKRWQLRFEGRHDQGLKGTRPFDGNAGNTSLALGLLYHFAAGA